MELVVQKNRLVWRVAIFPTLLGGGGGGGGLDYPKSPYAVPPSFIYSIICYLSYYLLSIFFIDYQLYLFVSVSFLYTSKKRFRRREGFKVYGGLSSSRGF